MKVFNAVLPLIMFFRPIPVHAAGLANEETTEAIEKVMNGPLTKLIGILIAFLIVTIFIAYIFQVVRLSFNPDLPIIRKDIMNNLAGLSGMLVAVGLFTSLGFGWLHRVLNGGKEAGAQVLADKDINVESWMGILSQYKNMATIFFAFAATTMVLSFILQISKLGTAASNPAEKSRAQKGLLWTGISAGILGGLTLVMHIFIDMGSVI